MRRRNSDQLGLQQTEANTYKSPQALGKALVRARKALPHSPRKRKTVLTHLTKDIHDLSSQSTKKSHALSMPTSTENKVREFYQNDEISWQAPGRKDFVRVGNLIQPKENVQKKIMLMTIDEAFESFKTVHPEVQIGRSSFFKLRPANVKPSSDMPHNVCVCRYHANMEMALTAASQICESIPPKCRQLCEKLVCSTENEECMTGKCEKCKDKATILIYKGVDEQVLAKEIEWKKWTDIEGRMKTVVETGSLSDLIHYIVEQLPSFLVHFFVKNMQHKYFQVSRDSIAETEAILQVDFAENYSAKVQDELQMLYWTHEQVTIFTGVAWVQSGHHSFAIISDELSHGKHTVWIFLKHIFKKLVAFQPDVKYVKIFSDGCAAQFKNKYTLSNLTFMHEDFGINGEWSFFASSHGKGAVDGVGGIVKRTVWNAVRTRKFVVTDAREFAECARLKTKNVNIIFVPKEEIETCKTMLNERWESVKTIQGTHSLHFFKPVSQYVLSVKSVSNAKHSTVISMSDEVQNRFNNLEVIEEPMNVADSYDGTINCGDFVDVLLTSDNGKQEKYRALVMERENDSLQLNYLKRSGKVWIYSDEISWESQRQVVCKLSQPRVLNSRQHMTFK